MKYSKYDVVIVGSGIAGLYLANKLSLRNEFNDGILIVTKADLFSGSSSLAQGGIVCVVPELNPKDSFESHIKDTINAGCGLNDINTVEFVSKQSSSVIEELIHFGVNFDKNSTNSLNFTLEGAHSCPRILHCQGDSTGRVIEKALCDNLSDKSNVDLYDNTSAVELLVDESDICRGLIVCNNVNGEFETIYSNNVVLATGGIGQVYKNTTNPFVATGDGIALAYRAGAEVENMEFVQFHPTALFVKNKVSLPLISESVRGEGAKLVDLDGEYFASNYHKLEDLAPRDVVSRAIKTQCELKNSEYVNLDISQIGIENFKKRFPTISKLCQENDIDFSNGLIPVSPAQHYFMGGIKVDLNSKTSIKNLYAIGECSSTGLHGANRLASNSLLECAVFAQSLFDYLIKNPIMAPKKHDKKVNSIIEKYTDKDFDNFENYQNLYEIFNKLKVSMSAYAGIVRNKKGLLTALDVISDLKVEMNKLSSTASMLRYSLENALLISSLIVKSALENNVSIGSHFRDDVVVQHNMNIKKKEKENELLFK